MDCSLSPNKMAGRSGVNEQSSPVSKPNFNSNSVVLPPGKLGLELEASRVNGQLGLKVRGWSSSIFQLSCLRKGTVITHIDSIEVSSMAFSEAAKVLRNSTIRHVKYISIKDKDTGSADSESENISPNQQRKSLTLKSSGNSRYPLGLCTAPRNKTSLNKGTRSPKNKKDVNNPFKGLGSPSVDKSMDESTTSSLFFKSKNVGKNEISSSVLEDILDENQHVASINCSLMVSTDSIQMTPTKLNHSSLEVESSRRKIIKRTQPNDEKEESNQEQLEISTQKLSARNNEIDGLRKEVVGLKGNFRESDAKIMLLKYQLGKKQPVLRKKQDMTQAKYENKQTQKNAKSKKMSMESWIKITSKMAPVLDSIKGIREERTAGNISTGTLHESFSQMLPSTVEVETEDFSTQCTLLNGEHESDAILHKKIAVQDRFIDRLQLQMRAYVDAQMELNKRLALEDVERDLEHISKSKTSDVDLDFKNLPTEQQLSQKIIVAKSSIESMVEQPIVLASLVASTPSKELSLRCNDNDSCPKTLMKLFARTPSTENDDENDKPSLSLSAHSHQLASMYHQQYASSIPSSPETTVCTRTNTNGVHHVQEELEDANDANQSIMTDTLSSSADDDESADMIDYCDYDNEIGVDILQREEGEDEDNDNGININSDSVPAIKVESKLDNQIISVFEESLVPSKEQVTKQQEEESTLVLSSILSLGDADSEKVAMHTPKSDKSDKLSHRENTNSEIKSAWLCWGATRNSPSAIGVSPASFRDNLSRLRGENTMMRKDIDRFRRKFSMSQNIL